MGPLDDIPDKSWDVCPKFNGDNSVPGGQHLDNFTDMCTNFNIITENMVVRLFIHSLEGEAAKWYSSLPHASITDWDTLMQ